MKYKYLLRSGLITAIVCFFTSFSSFGQLQTSDSLGCDGNTYLGTVLSGFNQATNIASDDNWSACQFPIGFTFNFYGVDYTQCQIGGNGAVTFDYYPAVAACASGMPGYPMTWVLQGSPGIPGNTTMQNAIAGCYSDIFPQMNNGGTISYATTGTAPNRIFVATWCNEPMFIPGTCDNDSIDFQILLYETSNNVEVHIGRKQVCNAWNGGLAIQGVENATGTVGTATPGRNNTQWTAFNDAQRFTPTAPNNTNAYTVAPIPYSPIPTTNSIVYWYIGNTLVHTGQNYVVTPTVTTTYTIKAIGCSDTSVSTITVTPQIGGGGLAPHIDSFHYTQPTACGYCDGTIVLRGLRPNLPDTVFYKLDGIDQPPISTTTVGPDSILTLSNLCVGTYSNIYVKVGPCISNPVGPVTLTTPPIVASFTDNVVLGCNGDVVTFYNNSSPVGTLYHNTWKFGDGTIDTTDYAPVYTYHQQGNFTVTLIVSDGLCTDSIQAQVVLNHPLTSVFTPLPDTVCLGQTINFANQSVGIGVNGGDPQYLWNFGDGLTDTAFNTAHIYAAPGTYNVSLSVTDFVPCTVTTTIPVRIEYFSVRTDFHDTTVCLTDSMQLKTYITSPFDLQDFIYAWSPGTGIGDSTLQQPYYMHFGEDHIKFTATSIPFGCVASDSVFINSRPPLHLTNVTADQKIPFGSSVQLNANGGDYYFWTPDNGTLDNPNINYPLATPTQPTYYVVHGMTQYGCRDSAVVFIDIDFGMEEFIPSAFSPNGDGRNDVFRMLNMKYQKLLDFRVYNRWGQMIYQSTDAGKGWDGTLNGVPQEVGVYNYVIIVARPDGTEKTHTGTVTLVR